MKLQLKLYTRYRLNNELEASVVLPIISRSYFFEYPLPTEVVVVKTETVTPRVARVYDTDVYYLEDEDRLVGYDELWSKFGSNFQGTHGTPGVCGVSLCEVWEETGDDGHVDYRFQGEYVLVKATDVVGVETQYGKVCAPVLANYSWKMKYEWPPGSKEGE